MKLVIQTLLVLSIAAGLGLSLGRLAQAAGFHSPDRLTIHSSLEPNVMLLHTSGRTIAFRTP
ncbi:hypothetical protein GCM10007276_22500 [Agaricicola taiwanensis]|uniref:Uncharacterized protein n=1 Tax=Agaricicola taiwanensis TaxID=591372 RepID=A0A8J2YIP7_9RHOB|nr:hypothetical protein [Agaricicola taiwanensis]GGE44874.1 hypothetical protein GCM10007276_22500 [Agaricicola taiwanensis]